MKTFIIISISFVLVLFPCILVLFQLPKKVLSGFALAQTTSEINLQHVELKKGQSAPYDGHLLSVDAIAKLLTEHKAEIDKLKLEIEKLKKSNELTLQAAKTEKTIVEKACEEHLLNRDKSCELEKNLLNKAIDRATEQCSRKWYESSWLPFLGGVIVCGGAVVAGASLN